MKRISNFLFDEARLQNLKRDWNRRFLKHGKKSNVWKIKYYFSQPQYRTLILFRLHTACKHAFLKKILRRLYRFSSYKSGLEITMQNIAGGVIMPHWGRIILNAERIGKDLYVLHNVTVGDDYIRGRPCLGDNVFIGVGATIIGNISIGDNVLIGAGSVVCTDIPANSVVAGNPAKVIRSINADYIGKLLGYALD